MLLTGMMRDGRGPRSDCCLGCRTACNDVIRVRRTVLKNGVIFVNNSDLADALAASNGISKSDARKYVDGVFAAIADAAAKGEEISLNGFGKFKVKESPAREGRNPSRSEENTYALQSLLRLSYAVFCRKK